MQMYLVVTIGKIGFAFSNWPANTETRQKDYQDIA